MSLDSPSPPSNLDARLAAAVKTRASFIKEESGSMTLVDVRRLLEEDLGLQKFELDPQKALVRKLVDEILLASENSEVSSQEDKEDEEKEEQAVEDHIERNVKERNSSRKPNKKASTNRVSQENVNENAEEPEHTQGRGLHDEGKKKKRKKEGKENVTKKALKREEEADEFEDRNKPDVSDNSTDVSTGKRPQKAQVKKSFGAKSAFEKEVEHLRKIIKACGLSIPPAIYKRAKQVSESKRGVFLVKELEAILSRHGLSSHPTEKEIKAVKRKREREKDLEGIDTTNIIMEPRGRRAAVGFFALPKYKEPVGVDNSDEDLDMDNSNEDRDGSPEDKDGSSKDNERSPENREGSPEEVAEVSSGAEEVTGNS